MVLEKVLQSYVKTPTVIYAVIQPYGFIIFRAWKSPIGMCDRAFVFGLGFSIVFFEDFMKAIVSLHS